MTDRTDIHDADINAMDDVDELTDLLARVDETIRELRETSPSGGKEWRAAWDRRRDVCERIAVLTPMSMDDAFRHAIETLENTAASTLDTARGHSGGDIVEMRRGRALQTIADVLTYADHNDLMSVTWAAIRQHRETLAAVIDRIDRTS